MITHPFHPLHGQAFPFVIAKRLWGEDRVTIQAGDRGLLALPANWTDYPPPDPYLQIGRGRARFRVADLLALAALIATRRTP